MIMYEGIGMDFWVLRGFLGGIVDVQEKKRREEKKQELSAVDTNVKLVRRMSKTKSAKPKGK